jgi:DTW domain-containing protein YfiP
MRSATPEGLEGHCLRCLLRQEVCLCERIPRIDTRVRVVIVRHVVERLRTSNTGRLAALALANSELLDYGDLEPLDEGRLAGEGTWLLYPSPQPPPADAPPCRRLIVLDGTWKQSRKMYARLAALRGLPRLSLPGPDLSVQRLRQPQREDGMSTIEPSPARSASWKAGRPSERCASSRRPRQAVVRLRGY